MRDGDEGDREADPQTRDERPAPRPRPGAGVPAPLTIDVGARAVPRLLAGGLVAVPLGLVVGGLLVRQAGDPSAENGPGVLVIGFVIAALIVLFGLFCLWGAHRGTGVRLVLDEEGFRREGPTRSWSLRWSDLERVGLSITVWSPPRAVTAYGRGQRTGRIVLAPRDPDDPRVAAVLGLLRVGDEPDPWTHRVSLGTNREWIASADEALGRLAGERYAGVHERETFRRRYS
ncbi:hypothetical protein [Patulibacter sp.]|uniref:hypothetical protein n=1 Tax=Patulibacter sp. TaxID=1912859 RepID=UPI0027288F4D|nr:hypothetical protein [Patulibacter sp.]MDO9407107.1 hypothetical protein [Patulibacter sp.]